MFASFDISTSALVAQRVRMNAISGNLANVSTTRNEAGQADAYRPRFVVFQTDNGIHGATGAVGVQVGSVETSQQPPDYRYEPGHPDAIKEGPRRGYVAYPNIDRTAEMVNAIDASRAYEANIGVIEVSKNLAQQALRILA